jgi:hypothetical protein
MAKAKITDVWKFGVDPVTHELVTYPRGKRPPYPKRNECPECWEKKHKLVKGTLEKYEFTRSTHRVYECPKCHGRWEGARTKKK